MESRVSFGSSARIRFQISGSGQLSPRSYFDMSCWEIPHIWAAERRLAQSGCGLGRGLFDSSILRGAPQLSDYTAISSNNIL